MNTEKPRKKESDILKELATSPEFKKAMMVIRD
jgi:hypothetical protein